MSHAERALARTALLIQRDIYPGLSEQRIVEHLTTRTIRLRADERNVADPAGQTAAVAFAVAAAQSGARLQIDLPDVALAGAQPPLADDARLATGLRDLCGRLISPPCQDGESAELTVLIGDTPAVDAGKSIRLHGGAFEGRAIPEPSLETAIPFAGAIPFGAHLAALAGAAECFREAMCELSEVASTEPLANHRIGLAGSVRLALAPLELVGRIDLGRVDFISAGAMTNGALAPLLRVPGLTGVLRVIDFDVVEVSNLNRYALVDLGMIGMAKVDVLARFAREGLAIEPLTARLSASEPPCELAELVMVGVDDLPSRWSAQTRSPGWVCVGATTRTELLVSEHIPGLPCAACMHPHDDEQGTGAIPTVAYVSQLAGVLQAHRLLANVLGSAPGAPVLAHGLALDGPRPLLALGQAPHPGCPLHCFASRSLAA
jgi:molybdopterin/thiamine biosynthesis adenylyltransferase